ncbi:hypothetical protein HJG60_010893 [Phyllostomus discolor]|uniref:Uncharacterized protein n=1 Tax=Phyllostomus discolor TaxID=89673 RepID=A0A834AC33_9CHIR|nr:hypothetical protein HJG60_010893 [Phyllostomus discolor]
MDVHSSRQELHVRLLAAPTAPSSYTPATGSLHTTGEPPPAAPFREFSRLSGARDRQVGASVEFFHWIRREASPKWKVAPLKSNPDHLQPRRSSRERRPRGSAEPAVLEEQRESAGLKGCCAHPAGSRALTLGRCLTHR